MSSEQSESVEQLTATRNSLASSDAFVNQHLNVNPTVLCSASLGYPSYLLKGMVNSDCVQMPLGKLTVLLKRYIKQRIAFYSTRNRGEDALLKRAAGVMAQMTREQVAGR